MGQTLVIAEKPSVAGDIARALGGFKKDGEFWVSENMIIGSAVGHLLEIAVPEDYDVKRGKWSFANLPVIPPYFDLKPIKTSTAKFNALQKMLKSRKVTDVINACDAGREGELIFRYIIQATGVKKPIRRLWLQSMTKSAICEAFEHLRSDEDMKALENAARSRSEADWLVGINGTRALTAFNSKDGGFFLTTVGRVQTPTLAIVVEREREITRFVSKPFWQVQAVFKTAAGTYTGTWQDANFKKDPAHPELRADRIWDKEKAEALAQKCREKCGEVSETSKRSTQASPALFDLTSLQRAANSKFGFPAKMTLNIAQRLYEKHKVLTYPRTDARALPEDYIQTAKTILSQMQSVSAYNEFAGEILLKGWVKPNDRIFNNKHISDHFAIIPTGEIPKALDEAEQKIFDLVAKRFLSVFYPPAVYAVTTRTSVVEDETFITEGKVLIEPGWLAVTGRVASADDLTPVKNGQTIIAEEVTVKSDATRPPARFTDATLLSAMEGAGKKLEEDALRGAMAEKGLGTPATRAQTIEGLLEQKYLRREERELIPNAKAFQLMQLLDGLKIQALTKPKLTAEWEYQLSLIEQGKLSRDAFMSDIRSLTESIVQSAKQYEGDSVPIENPIHFQHRCPACGGEVVENYQRFACTTPTCTFSMSKHPAGRVFEPEEVEELLANHRIGPLSGFMSRRGFAFDAELILDQDKETGAWGMRFDFEERPEPNLEDLKTAHEYGKCPCCKGRVLEVNDTYVCENAIKADKKCKFRIGKTILDRSISGAELVKLLETGKTDLLEGFISKKTKRPFKAYLVLDKKTQSVKFEFEERPKKGAVAKEAADT